MGRDDPRHRGQFSDDRVVERCTASGLDGRLRDTVIALRLGLLTALDANGLTRSELMATQRAVTVLTRSGTAPSAEEFWHRTALPRAGILVREANAVIDGELGQLAAAGRPAPGRSIVPGSGMLRLCRDARPGPGDGHEVGGGFPSGRATLAAEISRQLLAALPERGDLDRLGSWWLRRLRRAAMLQSLIRDPWDTVGLGPALTDHEIQLLDRPPWSHGDRLLSAFEMAHADIVRYGRSRIGEAADRIVGRFPLLPVSPTRAGT